MAAVRYSALKLDQERFVGTTHVPEFVVFAAATVLAATALLGVGPEEVMHMLRWLCLIQRQQVFYLFLAFGRCRLLLLIYLPTQAHDVGVNAVRCFVYHL